ncbi:jg8802 [Pararge aegeria aegeria]|uniref:Jg8802 protein n=1 Tax=Pararge aegeria aegeria TaxID=348720 RepID=A0A8S4S290_9NEOP|nr:jg8802 [Pararge aegeria aegeria]
MDSNDANIPPGVLVFYHIQIKIASRRPRDNTAEAQGAASRRTIKEVWLEWHGLVEIMEPEGKPKSFISTPNDYESDGEEAFTEVEIREQHTIPLKPFWTGSAYEKEVLLDASTLGDVPAVYRVPAPAPHQMPVIGVYIDPRVRTGFRYKIRPMQALDAPPLSVKPRYLFGGKALTLQSIGRGFARRFTFEPVDSTLNENTNYFWSDSRPEGFVFEIEAIAIGDKFTIYDANHEPQGTLEVVQQQKNQIELEQKISEDGTIEKKVKVNTLCKIEWYENDDITKLVPVTGVAILKKGRGNAAVTRVANVAIGIKQLKKGYELKPGIKSSSRRITVNGSDIKDIPCQYSIVGLERYEHPVIGTYIDPRIVPGFFYRVRPANSRHHLFEGRSLLLQSIGMGYGKRITFKPDTLNAPENYFWSDSHPEGVGMEPRAVHPEMKFTITGNGGLLGEAMVFRADLPQIEEKTEYVDVPGKRGKAVEKYIQVDVTCHVKLATTGGGSVDSEVHLMKVSGTALVRKEPGQAAAKLVKVFNVGLDSQLNLLFAHSQTELTFHPLP